MKRKKGISTIIGAVFFMIVIIATLSVMSWVSLQQGNFTTTAVEVTRLQSERASSDLEVTDVRIDNKKFNITLQNNGPLAERIVRLWVTNETATNWHNKYEVNHIAGPKQVLTNVGQDIPLGAVSTDAYALKFVTEKGGLINFRSLSVAQADIGLSMYVIPSTISPRENVTIMMSVTNNAREVDSIHDIQPTMDTSPTCVGSKCPTITMLSEPNGIDTLPRGSTALFKWIYNIDGPEDSKVTFTGTLVGAKPGNSVSDSVTISLELSDANIKRISALLISNAGHVSMNFESFQFCEPNAKDCRSNSPDWAPGWQVQEKKKYIWRVNLTNNGPKDIMLEKNTALLMLEAQTGGGGNLPSAMFIKKDSNVTHANAGAYNDYSKILKANGTAVQTIYLGAENAGSATLIAIPHDGLYAVNLILFGFIDANNDGKYKPEDDKEPYSQNLPFQGLYALPCKTCE